MTPTKPPQNRRVYQRHGLRSLQTALKTVGDREGWLEGLGEVGATLQAWQADLVADLGGEAAVSAQERAVVELAVKTHLLLESVDRWLLEQPSLVNKSRRQLFPVVLQRQQLADALARYMTQLGLRRRAKPVPSLQEYLAARYGGSGQEIQQQPGESQNGEEIQRSERSQRSPRSAHQEDVDGGGPPRGSSPILSSHRDTSDAGGGT